MLQITGRMAQVGNVPVSAVSTAPAALPRDLLQALAAVTVGSAGPGTGLSSTPVSEFSTAQLLLQGVMVKADQDADQHKRSTTVPNMVRGSEQFIVVTSADMQCLAEQLRADVTEALALDYTDACQQEDVDLVLNGDQHFDSRFSALQEHQLQHRTGWIAVATTPVSRKAQRLLLAAAKAALFDRSKKLGYMFKVTLKSLQAVLGEDIMALEDRLPSDKLKMVIMDAIYLARVALLTCKLLKNGPSQATPTVPNAATLQQQSTAVLAFPAASGGTGSTSTGTPQPPAVPPMPPAWAANSSCIAAAVASDAGTNTAVPQYSWEQQQGAVYAGMSVANIGMLHCADGADKGIGLSFPATSTSSIAAGILVPAVPPAGASSSSCAAAAGASAAGTSTAGPQHSFRQMQAGVHAPHCHVESFGTAMLHSAAGAQKSTALDFPAVPGFSTSTGTPRPPWCDVPAVLPAGASFSSCPAAAVASAAGSLTAWPQHSLVQHRSGGNAEVCSTAMLHCADGAGTPSTTQPLAIPHPTDRSTSPDASTIDQESSATWHDGVWTITTLGPSTNGRSTGPGSTDASGNPGLAVAESISYTPAAPVRQVASPAITDWRLITTIGPSRASTTSMTPAGRACSSPEVGPFAARHPLGSGWTGPDRQEPCPGVPSPLPLAPGSSAAAVSAQAPSAASRRSVASGNTTAGHHEEDAAGVLQASVLAQASSAAKAASGTADGSAALASTAPEAGAEGGGCSNTRQHTLERPVWAPMAYNKRLYHEFRLTQQLANASPQQLLQLVSQYRPADAGDSSRAYLVIKLLHEELCRTYDDYYVAAQPRTAAAANNLPPGPNKTASSSSSAPGSLRQLFRHNVMVAAAPELLGKLVLMPWPLSLIARLLNPGLDSWLQLPRTDLYRKLAVRGSTLQVQDQKGRDAFVPPGAAPGPGSLLIGKDEPLLPVHMLHCSSMVCACDQFALPEKQVNDLKYAVYATSPFGLRTFLMAAIPCLKAQLEEGILAFDMGELHAPPSTADRHEHIVLQLNGVLGCLLRFCQAVKLAVQMEYGSPGGGMHASKIVVPAEYIKAATQELLANSSSSSNAISTAPGVVAGETGPTAGSSTAVLISLMRREAEEAAAELSLWLQAGKERPPCSPIIPPEGGEQQRQQGNYYPAADPA